MIRFIVFALLAGAAYYFTRNWMLVAAVACVYILYSVLAGIIASSKAKQRTDTLLHRKLSEDEKKHLAGVAEHQQAMHAHKAQFDPELRKKS